MFSSCTKHASQDAWGFLVVVHLEMSDLGSQGFGGQAISSDSIGSVSAVSVRGPTGVWDSLFASFSSYLQPLSIMLVSNDELVSNEVELPEFPRSPAAPTPSPGVSTSWTDSSSASTPSPGVSPGDSLWAWADTPSPISPATVALAGGADVSSPVGLPVGAVDTLSAVASFAVITSLSNWMLAFLRYIQWKTISLCKLTKKKVKATRIAKHWRCPYMIE